MALTRKQERAVRTELPEDPLQVVPCIAPNVQVRAARNGDYHLRKLIPPSNPTTALIRRVLHWKKETFVNLDARGTDFWKLINGKRTLQDIASILAAKWRMDNAECREAVVVYTRALMLRELIVLEVRKSIRDGSSA